MQLYNETGLVRDSEGVEWECRWQRLEGFPIPKITRVRLRKPGTDTDTHYVDAPWAADIFKPPLIDGDFVPIRRRDVAKSLTPKAERLFRIELRHTSGDIVVRKGLVTDATPPFRGIKGNEMEKVRAWVRLRGGMIEEIEESG